MSALVGGGLIALAAAMAVATAWLIRVASEARDRRQAAVAVFLVAMMAEMFVGAWIAVVTPGTAGIVSGLSASGALMALSAGLLFAALGPRGAPAPTGAARGVYLAAIAACVVVGEALMAATFDSVAGTAAASGATGLAATVLSPWFVFTMAAEMGITTVLLWRRLPTPLRVVLPLQAVVMAFSPPTVAGAAWTTLAVAAGSVAMIAVVVFQMEYLYRHRTVPVAIGRYWLALLAVYGVMMTGLVVWLVYGVAAVFAGSLVLEMALYLAVVVAPESLASDRTFTWTDRPGWTTALLALVFVAELMMGAALDLQIEPSAYAGQFFVLPVAGAPLAAAYAAFYNGFWFFATVAGSTWFLAMMGAEMGTLVVFKLRESHDGETRVRLGVMLGAYAAFAVFFPSIYYGLAFPTAPGAANPLTVPVLGWSMGIGSAPLAVSVFGVLIVTYVAMGVLSALFGRRWVCSVFCTAPTMYQGTTIDAMKRFNHTSPLARKYLSSRLSAVYTTTLGVVMVALVGTSVASYLDSTGAWNVSILGADPSVFLFVVSFSILWYVLFVTIPYAGDYNCVTMGWCYTGIISGAISRVGFFSLRVKSKQVCRDCTTVDCARGCPVGLVDMPGHFRKTGEFRSSKCCGVGGCVNACP
ncbi:MAG TPA: hypothetical protein VMG36_03460, partial [Thermoplasmata archaeon]|nr:hypothetical protein [Thermoplasmata archaeon]